MEVEETLLHSRSSSLDDETDNESDDISGNGLEASSSSSSSPTNSNKNETFCRICQNPSDSENPLRHPCACKGSFKFVHQDCLLQWLNHNNTTHCEVCKHVFSFSIVYAENAPTRLPLTEFVVAVAMKACHVLKPFLRICFVVPVWFLILLVMFWIWRLAFVRSLGEAGRLFFSHISAANFLTDCFHGFLLTACSFVVVAHNDPDSDESDDALDDAYDTLEVFGMRGSFYWFGKAITVLLRCNMIFLGVVFFAPFMLGRIILHYISWFYKFSSLSAASSSMLSMFMPITESALYLKNISLKNALSVATNLSSEIQHQDGLLSQAVDVIAETLNACTAGLEEAPNFVGMPLSAYPSSHQSDDVTTLVTGYLFIVSLVILYLGSITLIRYIKGEATSTVGRQHYVIVSIEEGLSFLIRLYLVVIEVGVIPLICGWWLDFCTIGMLGKTISQRVEFFSNFPLESSGMHWMVGVLYLLQIEQFISLLQGVLHNGVPNFLPEIYEPIFDDPVHKRVCTVLWSIASYGIFTVFLVFLPLELAMHLAPSIFPLDISASDPFTEISAGLLLLKISLPLLSQLYFNLCKTIEALLCRWFTAVGWALSLTDFLLPRTDIGRQENVNVVDRWQDRLLDDVQINGDSQQQDQPPTVTAGHQNRNTHTSGNVDVVEEYDGHDETASHEYGFVFRIVMLLVLTWMALLLKISALIILPISLGRALFNLIPVLPIMPGIKLNDIYTFIIGSCTIWIFLSGVRYFIRQVKAWRAQILELGQILKWFGIVLKISALLSIWILVIPVLIGLLFEHLVIVPMRVLMDEIPVFLLYQDWVMGLFFFDRWTTLVVQNPKMALVDESWRIKFMRFHSAISEDVFPQLEALWMLQPEIVFPIIRKLLTALCVPYLFARVMFLALGYPINVNPAVYRFAWVGCLTITELCSGALKLPAWFTNLHNSIRDERYLNCLRLDNFVENGQDEAFCRICHNPSDSESPLRHPCVCKGSIKFVHQDCLLQWLNHSNATHCEVCKHVFSFSIVYAENAPKRLPLAEFVVAVAMKACHVLKPFLRNCFVVPVWFLILLVMFWIWRLAFVRSLGEAGRLFFSHISAANFLTDCFHGFLLTASSFFVVVHNESDSDESDDVLDDVLEVFGMQGDFYWFGKATTVLLRCNMIFLGVVFFAPFMLGRVILHYISWFYKFSSLSAAISSKLSTLMPITESALYLINISLKNALSVATSLSSEIHHQDGLLSQAVDVIAETLNASTAGLEEASNFVGKPLSADPSSCQSDDITTLVTGYLFIVSLVILYLGSISLIRYIKGEATSPVGRQHYVIVSIEEGLSFLIRLYLVVIEVGVLPSICGWWLDFCTIRVLGKTISQRVEFFSNFPLESSGMHWMVGILYLLQIEQFISLLQEDLHYGVLKYLPEIYEPIFDDPVHKRVCTVLWSIASYGIFTVFLVFLPLELAMRLAPSIFPLDISASDPFTEISAGLLLLKISLPLLSQLYFKLSKTIKALLSRWFTAVGWALGLTDFLLPRTDIGRQENVNVVDRWQDRLLDDVQINGVSQQQDQPPTVTSGHQNRNTHTSGNVDVVEEYDGHDETASHEYGFVFRIVLLLVLTWMALLLKISALIIVPISLGRALFNLIPILPIMPGIKLNDIYTFIIGSCTIWIFLSGVRYFIEQVKAQRAQILELGQILKWFGIVLKISALILIWILVIPVLIGLLFEHLVIVPMRVLMDEIPVLLLYQDWVLGLFFFDQWATLVQNPRMPLVDESWRIKFMRFVSAVSEDGFSQLEALWVLQPEIVIPIIRKLLTALCVRYLFARVMFLVLGYPMIVNSAVYRFAWVGCLTITVLCFSALKFLAWFTNLHNSIRDERYLNCLRLDNFGEDSF